MNKVIAIGIIIIIIVLGRYVIHPFFIKNKESEKQFKAYEKELRKQQKDTNDKNK